MSSAPNPKKVIAEFPDVEAKLQKPAKQSAFERQKAEAEAKRRREAAETAAVYEDFVKSFERDDNSGDDSYRHYHGNRGSREGGSFPPRFPGRGGGGGGGGGAVAAPGGVPERPAAFGVSIGAGKRHFGASSAGPAPLLRSGPGSLGPAPPSFGSKKRPFDGRDGDGGADDSTSNANANVSAGRARLVFEASDEDEDEDKKPHSRPRGGEPGGAGSAERAEERAIAKPTLWLANLPPGTSPAAIRALMPPALGVENVKIVPPSGPGGSNGGGNAERKSIAAIVTLSKDTPATELDAAVGALQNRYLGFGFFLSLHRHLSSTAVASGLPNTLGPAFHQHQQQQQQQPFGAKRVDDLSHGGRRHHHHRHRNNHHHHPHGRGYAPPSTYDRPPFGPGDALSRGAILHVPIRAPRDIKMLRAIHKVVEAVLQYGPEFEALLMSRPDVQREERWAWLWDARSEGGVWYRWRLWEIVTGSPHGRRREGGGRGARSGGGGARYVPLFEGSHAWKVPDAPLAYEYTTDVREFVSDSEYDSSDEDEDDDGGGGGHGRDGGGGGGVGEEDTFLNPIEKAKLTHLLARLPRTLSKIRKGDIARITTFAVTHASRGADEIVDMIVANIERPFSYTRANPAHNSNDTSNDSGSQQPKTDSLAPADADEDTSGARLLGLYVASDILSSSSTSGVRHAWRYRQLFERALRARGVFAALGALPERLRWGRLRADKWRRSVRLVLGLWEGWCVFPVQAHEAFVASFEQPPPASSASLLAGTTTATVPGVAQDEGGGRGRGDGGREDRPPNGQRGPGDADKKGPASRSSSSRWKTIDGSSGAAAGDVAAATSTVLPVAGVSGSRPVAQDDAHHQQPAPADDQLLHCYPGVTLADVEDVTAYMEKVLLGAAAARGPDGEDLAALPRREYSSGRGEADKAKRARGDEEGGGVAKDEHKKREDESEEQEEQEGAADEEDTEDIDGEPLYDFYLDKAVESAGPSCPAGREGGVDMDVGMGGTEGALAVDDGVRGGGSSGDGGSSKTGQDDSASTGTGSGTASGAGAAAKKVGGFRIAAAAAPRGRSGPRRRVRAVDMFAGSGSGSDDGE